MVRPTVQRGSKEDSGSCCTTAMRRRRSRRRRSGTAVHGSPSRVTCPVVGSVRASAIHAVVDLPEPDSPTIPRVSPSCRVKETSSTTARERPSGPR